MTRSLFKEPPMTEEQVMLRAMIKDKVMEFDRLSAEQRAEIIEAQRESWVRGETGFDRYGETRIKK